jgi:hypothetical protein
MGRKIFTNFTIMPSHEYIRPTSYITEELGPVRDSQHALPRINGSGTVVECYELDSVKSFHLKYTALSPCAVNINEHKHIRC